MNPRALAIDDTLARLHRSDARVADGARSLSAAALVELAAAIEAWLQARGLGPEAPILFECDNSVPALAALLALLRGETSFVLVPPPPTGLERPRPPRFCRWCLRPRADVDAGEARPDRLFELDALAPTATLVPALRRARLLLRTSGSLGAPKLVAHSHAGVLANAANAVARLDLRGDDRVLIPVPVAHMYGLGAALLPALAVGASVELIADANLLRCLERERTAMPSIGFFTPNLARTLARPRTRPPEHYRHVVVAGDRLDPELFAALERIYGRVVNLYGSTELGVVCAGDPRARDPHDQRRVASVGRALPGVELELAPAAELASPRELLCRHPFGFETYVDARGEVLEPATQPYRTRDLAVIDADGFVELLGRCDHAVKRDGRLVALAEVERALRQLPGVEQAAAVVAGESKRGRGIVAFCSLESAAAAAPEPEALRRACQDRLPAYAVPDDIRLLARLPALASGKLDRDALRRMTLDPRELGPASHASTQTTD